MSQASGRENPFFRMTAVSAAAFVFTVLALVATMFGDPKAPPAVFLNDHGGKLVIGEVAAVLVCGLLALIVDRRRSLREALDEPSRGVGPSQADPKQTGSGAAPDR